MLFQYIQANHGEVTVITSLSIYGVIWLFSEFATNFISAEK